MLGLRDAPPGELADPLYALSWLVANLAERSPVLLALDDLQWLDAESGRFVAYLAQRLDGVPVLLAATARTGEPGPMDVLRRTGSVLRPPALSPAASAAVTGGATTAAEAHRLTGGNPFLLTELAAALERAAPGTAPDRLDIAGVAQSLAQRVERLSPAAVTVADALALFPGGARLADVAAVADLATADAAQAADALIGAHVVAERDGGLEFVHPILRSARYGALGPFARRHGHARTATALRARGAPTEEVAAHLLAGEPAGDRAHVAILRAAADTAIAAVAPRAAVRYLARALEEGAATPGEQRAIRLELGRLQRLIGDAAAQATLAAAFEGSRGTPDEIRAAIELAATAFSNADTVTVHRTVAAMKDVDLPPDERIVLDMLRAETLWSELEFDAAVELIDRLPADLPGETAAQRMALGMAGSVRFMRGDPLEEVLDMLRRAARGLRSGGTNNKSTAPWSTVLGYFNTAAGNYSTIAGGYSNTTSNFAGFVGGGHDNAAKGHSSAILGGNRNVAEGDGATVTGGFANTARSAETSILGGNQNVAAGKWGALAGGKLNTITALNGAGDGTDHWVRVDGNGVKVADSGPLRGGQAIEAYDYTGGWTLVWFRGIDTAKCSVSAEPDASYDAEIGYRYQTGEYVYVQTKRAGVGVDGIGLSVSIDCNNPTP